MKKLFVFALVVLAAITTTFTSCNKEEYTGGYHDCRMIFRNHSLICVEGGGIFSPVASKPDTLFVSDCDLPMVWSHCCTCSSGKGFNKPVYATSSHLGPDSIKYYVCDFYGW